MSIPTYKRSDRVAKLLHEEVSKIVHGLKDPRLGFVTIVELKLSDDMTEAKVYFSILGDEAEKKTTAETLKGATGFIRNRLKEIVELRIIPNIRFVYDDTAERAARLFSIFNEIEKDKESQK